MQTGGGSGSQEPSLGTLESLPHALLEPSLSPALGLSWSGRQWGGAESQKGWGGEDEVGGSRVDQSRVHACPGSWREAVRAGREGAQVGGQAHHTEHLWAGFMGESLGQWKARPNSSNWDTLPSTLERDPQRVGPRGHQTPAVLSHPTDIGKEEPVGGLTHGDGFQNIAAGVLDQLHFLWKKVCQVHTHGCRAGILDAVL